MSRTWIALLPPLLVFAPAIARAQCAVTAERVATLPATGLSLLRIVSEAGDLQVVGRPGLREVRVRGTACASNRELLDGLVIGTAREGSEARITAATPTLRGGGRYASLDLVVEIPETLGLEVTDASGDVEVSSVAGLTLRDQSGDVTVRDLRGSLDVQDESGDVEIAGVRGDVRLEDDSGDLRVRDVTGGVLVERDGSGDVHVAGVGGDVEVRYDSSGDIFASGVRGDFTVARDDGGDVHHSEIAGRVTVPRRR